ncbi:GNAT family N-acetyltransferase [Phycicoccus flavus]|uniref:GNAT family N-acetyltransferase n=1 Tax=Phycicoccus flavus TaxID=2502783 RepID=UPI000FEB74EA|nr:GNAT family N-acetyltransferase [Phycicoccus flavus]NHA67474.1 GNAT family N-acetyltransferase [Phycicoccus flavus]
MAAMIRPRTDNDLPALAKVLVEVHAVDGYPVEGVDDPLAWLDLPNAIGVWTAELGGAPVGHVALTEPGPGDDAARLLTEQSGPEPMAVLGRLFVAPAARGQGLAEQLVNTAMCASAEIQRQLVLDVMVKDRAAFRLYERLGWRTIGEITHQYGANNVEGALALAAPRPREICAH